MRVYLSATFLSTVTVFLWSSRVSFFLCHFQRVEEMSAPLGRLAQIGSVGAAVEFSWAAGEAVLVPYLERGGVAPWVSSLAYMMNPAIGLCVMPPPPSFPHPRRPLPCCSS